MSATRLFPCLLVLPLLLLGGCVGYQFGSSLPKQYRSVCVKTFINKTGEANLEFPATQAARREFQKDAALSLEDAEKADLILETELVAADFDALRFARNRAATADEYRMTVQAEITLTVRKTGAVLIAKRKVTGKSTYASSGDAQQARLNAQPTVSSDLGRQIVKNVVEFW